MRQLTIWAERIPLNTSVRLTSHSDDIITAAALAPTEGASAPSSGETRGVLLISLNFVSLEHIALGCLPGCNNATFINVFSELEEHIALSPWLGCDDAFFIFNSPKLKSV